MCALATGVVNSFISSGATGYDSKVWESLTHFYDTQAWIPKNVTFVNKAAFGLELRLARPPGPYPAAETRQHVAPPSKPRKAIVQLRQLDLQLPLGGTGVLGEDVEDQRGPVDDLQTPLGERVHPRGLLQVPPLSRSQLVVEDQHVGVERVGDAHDLPDLALAEVRARVGAVSSLKDAIQGVGTGRVGQGLELVQRPFRRLAVFLVEDRSYEDGAFPLRSRLVRPSHLSPRARAGAIGLR